MKRASVSETKNQLSALLEQVRHGETVVITDHERPVARITAVAGTDPTGDRLAGLERKGLVRRGGGRRCVLGDPAVPSNDASALEALLAERVDGR